MHTTRITRLGLFFVLCTLLFGAIVQQNTGHAQDDNTSAWSIWLYQEEYQTLVRIGLDGTVIKELPLPLSEDNYPLQPTFSFSPDGNLLASCSINADETNATLTVYDTVSDEILQTRELGDVTYCTLLARSFSTDGRFLAYGAIYDFYTGQPEELWLFEVMDIATGEIVATLSPDEPALDVIQYSSLPGSVYFDADAQYIIISMEGYAVDGGFPTTTFIWRYGTGEFTPQPDNLYGKRGLSILPKRGEIVWLDRNDEDYTPSEILGPSPNLNVVMSSDKTGEHKVIAALGPAQGASLHYIQNGERVLLHEYGYDTEIQDIYSAWSILSRTGERVFMPDFESQGVVGTETGFVMLQPIDTGIALIHYQFDGDVLNDEILWQITIEDTTQWWIVWSTSLEGASDLPAWTAQ